MFEQKYDIVQTIGQSIPKLTSIVKNKQNNYFIAKKVPIDDKKTIHEIAMMRNLSHPNIIALHQIIQQGNWAYIIEEYCEEGDLEFHLRRHLRLKKSINEDIAARWLLQMLLALEYLHNLKIIHRDIRPRNIFLTSSGNIKIGSFKVSKQLQSEVNYTKTLINSPYYIAPELMQGKGYDYKVDIWAFGCVLYQICSLKLTVNVSNIGQMLLKMNKSKFDDLPTNYSKQLNILYHKCMKKSSIQRISAENLLKTSYFLESMEKFIIDKGFNLNLQQKIPIKKYNIHKTKYEKIKIKKKVIKTPQISTKAGSILPQLGIKSHRIQKKNSNKSKSIQRYQVFTSNPIKPSKDYPKQITQKEQRVKSLSKDPKILLLQPPCLLTKDEIQSSKNQQQKINLLAPPQLPKPTKKTDKMGTQKRAKTGTNQKDIIEHFQTTLSKQQLQRQLNVFQNKQSQIHQNIGKIFHNLNLKEQDEEQIQFEFQQCQQQNMLRLTSKKSEQTAELLTTFKSKLQQLIEEINYKYCPNLQPIPEKPSELDSYSFSKIKSLLQAEEEKPQ